MFCVCHQYFIVTGNLHTL